jgi:UDPglucose--hexose-1-phosphate uridylyltransferase
VSELRWHPLLEQWVVVTTHRQDRPQMPADWCPFCPGSGRVPDHYDVALYSNDFPAFSFEDPSAPGACDVVLYSPEHSKLPSELPVEQWEKVIALWTRRTQELAADPRVKHVAVFENTGEAVGVTMPHPHGQIYAFPFFPPRIEREMTVYERAVKCPYCAVLESELGDGRRVIVENSDYVLFAPHFARFPYETAIYARTHVRDLASAPARTLAEMISTIRKKYDALWKKQMPLMMVVHQFAHLYIEFLPIQRSAAKLKFLASVETSLGTFLNDVAPERAAEELRAV